MKHRKKIVSVILALLMLMSANVIPFFYAGAEDAEAAVSAAEGAVCMLGKVIDFGSGSACHFGGDHRGTLRGKFRLSTVVDYSDHYSVHLKGIEGNSDGTLIFYQPYSCEPWGIRVASGDGSMENMFEFELLLEDPAQKHSIVVPYNEWIVEYGYAGYRLSTERATAGEIVNFSIYPAYDCFKKIDASGFYLSTKSPITDAAYEYKLPLEACETDEATGAVTGSFVMPDCDVYLVMNMVEIVETEHFPLAVDYYNLGLKPTTDDEVVVDYLSYCPVCGRSRNDRYHITANRVSVSMPENIKTFQWRKDSYSTGEDLLNNRDGVYYGVPWQEIYFYAETDGPCVSISSMNVEISDPSTVDFWHTFEVTDHGNNLYSFRMPPCMADLTIETVTSQENDGSHTLVEVERKNEIAATCTSVGGYDVQEECSVCGFRPAERHVETEMADHTPGSVVVENYKLPTDKSEGGYDLVVRCTECSAVISSTHTVIEKTTPGDEHTPGRPVVENFVAPTTESEGSFEVVVYCADCGEELSREKITIEKLSPADSDQSDSPSQSANLCRWCGKDHSASFVQRFIGFFHNIMYAFAHLFGRK